MNILIAASEGVPYSKTGGLADVIGALPVELAKKRHTVRVVLPLYRFVDRVKYRVRPADIKFKVPLGTWHEDVEVWESRVNSFLTVYFIACSKYFDRSGIYGYSPGTDFHDNDLRFALFSRSVLELIRALDWVPDVLHMHDWQTGLVAPYLKTVYASDPKFGKIATVFTIHNMAYQGLFPGARFKLYGLPAHTFSMSGLEFWGHVNFMKGGLVYSDILSTVSPTYSREILSSSDFGFGLEGVLQGRKAHLHGILNGLDVERWNPMTDVHLQKNFGPLKLKDRALCKKDLQLSAGLAASPSIPVLGFVGRLDRQKGVDFIVETAPALLQDGVQMVLLGVGDRQLQAALHDLERRYLGQVYVEDQFADPLAHKIYGGADLFLMPSRFEPCGLGQMIAMRYGAVPVVTPTGGLLDTVVDAAHTKTGTGFVAGGATPAAYLAAIRRALKTMKTPARWKSIQGRGMRKDFSWTASVPQYMKLYEAALSRHAAFK